MSINVSVGFQIPTNVVEVGNEISTQQLGAITSGSSPTSANPFTTVSYISGLSYLTTSSASTTYAPKASPTFTGVVTIPAGASISGYLTTATASSTYQPIGSYLVDAPSDGSEYVRKNAAWAVVTGGGGIADAPSNGNLYARQNAAWTSFSVTPSVTNIDLTGNFNGYSMGSGYYSFKYDSTANTLRMQDGAGSGITVSATAITFPDSTTQTTASIPARTINQVFSGPYTIQLSDANKIIHLASGSMGFGIGLDTDSNIAYVDGTVIFVTVDSVSYGYSIVNAGASGVNINAGSSFSITSSVTTLIKVAANTWFAS